MTAQPKAPGGPSGFVHEALGWLGLLAFAAALGAVFTFYGWATGQI